MRKIIKTFVGLLLTVVLIEGCLENKSSKMDKTQNQIEFWSQKIMSNNNAGTVFYHLYSGEQYANDKWVTEKPAENEDYFIGEKVSFWTDSKIGSFFETERSSPSGDWTIFSKNYYGPDKKLNLVLWTMNTTQVQPEPLTIKRKFIFDKSGIVMQKCESVFQMDSKKPVENPNYLNHEAKYWKTLNDLPFFNLLKSGK